MGQTSYLLLLVYTIVVLICSTESFGLPNTTIPSSYDVTLTVDLDRYRFFGSVKIAIDVLEATNSVTLNVKDLNISNVALTDSAGNNQELVDSVNQYDSEEVTFNFNSYLSAGSNYHMAIQFAGAIADDLKGLYRSSYYSGSEERFVATTFNAAAYARKIFPCYDEPHLKATFRLQIYHKPQFHALSNMHIERKIDPSTQDNLSLTVFAESPPMSTYLFAFVVSDFSRLEGGDKISAYAQPSVINSTEYALGFTRDAIGHLSRAFQRPYQLAKLDIVAVDDFLMGAMENWGLITYKTSRIVYRKGLDRTEKLQSVTKIVFHELIHQWFGNEVTCAWWSYVWLNEGFTTFLESYILSQMYPEWNLMDQFLVNEMHPVMERDVLPDTRAMTKEINSPAEIAGIYDFVVYPKAASVIRMFHSLVGATAFDQFLVDYLNDRSYNSSTEDDMIRVLQRTVDRHNVELPPIEDIVKSWTHNPSYPIVTITRDNADFASVTAEPGKTFYIPLNWISKSSKSGRDWMTNKEASKTIAFKNVKSDEWILANPHQYGYYRVNYDRKNWDLLTATMHADHRQIPLLSRAQLLDDALALVKDDALKIDVLLDLLNYLPKENDFVPLKAGFKVVRYLHRTLRGNDLYVNYHNHLVKLLGQVYDRMLLNTAGDHVSKLYQTEVRKIACELGVPRCLQDAIGMFEGFELIDPDLRAAVICGAMKGTENYNVWTTTVRRMVYIVRNFEEKRINAEEFEDILYGFGCSVSEERLESYLLLSMSTTDTLEQGDRIKMFNYIANSGVNGTNMALNRLNTDFNTIKRRYGSTTEIVSNLKYAISTPTQLQAFKVFMEKTTDPTLQPIVQGIYDVASKNIRWTEDNLPSIDKWLSGAANAAPVISKILLLLVAFTTVLRYLH
ncbi:aminopeptidase N [Culex quinquefasciatus]|uniref:aminopeptidase N n=1 Tax=Culex quinquefasciatus TaxID=7176 RepID=UPI0018E333E5|nr:aminopeptidase N [Culex quinquefasciatus]